VRDDALFNQQLERALNSEEVTTRLDVTGIARDYFAQRARDAEPEIWRRVAEEEGRVRRVQAALNTEKNNLGKESHLEWYDRILNRAFSSRRDGSGAYGEAVRQALPSAVQVSDRWHLWHGLGEAVRKEVAAHSACWAKGIPLQDGKRAATTAERWQQVHDLRVRNVGLLDCARRLGLSLNTVKRYDRASEPERLQRVPKYRPTLVDPHRDYLCKRRAEEPGVPVQQLLREIRERGYQGSSNLLVATSIRAAWTATARTCHPAGPPGSCSPGRTTSRPASKRRSPASKAPARR
jgi:hypothetical protein